MVGAINPNSSTPLSTQQTLARDSAYMLNPGEDWPEERPLPSNLPTSAPLAPPVPSGKHVVLTKGAIAGISIGAVCVVILGAILFFFWGHTKSLKDEVNRKESSVTRRLSAQPQTSQQPPPPQAQGQGQTIGYPTPTPGHARHGSQGFYPPPPHPPAPPIHQVDNKYSHIPSSPPLHTHPAFHPRHSPAPYELSNQHNTPATYFTVRTQSPYSQTASIGAAPPYG